MLDDSIEEWLAIERTQGNYEISNYGRVRRARPGPRTSVGLMLSISMDRKGYPQVWMWCAGKKIRAKVHVLVAEAFLGPKPSQKHQVNHLDGVKTHSYVGNLEWTTPSGNVIHAIRHGLITPPRPSIGERNGQARLTARQVRAIRRVSREFTQAEVAEVLGVSRATVGRARRGELWGHVV